MDAHKERFRTEAERNREVEVTRAIRRAETLLRLRALDQQIERIRAELAYTETVRSDLEIEAQIYAGTDAASVFTAARQAVLS